jgi:hypothetical protein
MDAALAGRRLRTPVRMLPRVCTPVQTLEVEVPRVAEEVSQLHKKTVGYVAQPKDSDVPTPALWAAGTHSVLSTGVVSSSARDGPHARS